MIYREPERASIRLAFVVSIVVSTGACFSAGEEGPRPSSDASSSTDTASPDTSQNVDVAPESCEGDCDVVECAETNGGVEICDGRDNDCDGRVDEEATDAPTWYADGDGDSLGNPDETKQSCDQPEGYVDNDDDCDDSDETVKLRTAYVDEDGDGYTIDQAEEVCAGETPPEGYAYMMSDEPDCDDTNENIHPDATEVCDGNDTDCDGDVDNIAQQGSEGTVWYVDCDDDDYSPGLDGNYRSCEKPPASKLSEHCNSSVADWTDTDPSAGTPDCNDDNPDAYPGASAWHARPMDNGSTKLEKWDYDCDDTIEKRYTEMSACDPNSSEECTSTIPGSEQGDGWIDRANPDVECGVTAKYHHCGVEQCCFQGTCMLCPACEDDSTMKTQECR